jgi:hypothetical protein
MSQDTTKPPDTMTATDLMQALQYQGNRIAFMAFLRNHGSRRDKSDGTIALIWRARIQVGRSYRWARKIALRRSLGEVEEEVTAMMGRSTSIMEDGGIVLEGIPYPLLSTSTKYLVDLCLRLVLAKRSGAPMIMIDGIDVLKDMRLYDAVNHILASGVKAIVAGAELPDFVISKGAAIRMTDGARTA